MSFKIFSGDNASLALSISAYLEQPLARIEVQRFADGEERVQLQENIRKSDVFLLQSTHQPLDNLFRLCEMINAARRSSAKEITAVVPYFGYGRQDRKDRPRVPVTARMVFDFLEVAGANRILTMDMHVNQMEGFSSLPLDHLYARDTLIAAIREEFPEQPFRVLAPDAGATSRAEGYSQRLGDRSILYVHKKKIGDNQPKLLKIVGDIEPGETVLVIDDMADTASTLVNVADALSKENGVDVMVAFAHGIFSLDAIERLGNSPIKRVYLTDSIEFPQEKLDRMSKFADKFRIVSVAPLFGEAIRRIHNGESVSALFQ